MRGGNLRKLLTIGAVAGVVWATAGAATQAPTTDHAPGAPTGLTVDDDPAPLAVTGAPAFGWIVNDPDRGEIQTAYELVVSDAPTAQRHNVVFDSGPVTSNQQAYVEAPALRLLPDHTYWWTVRTQDASGRFGPYAADAHFDTGLGDADWHAAWIRRSGTVPRSCRSRGPTSRSTTSR